MWSFEPQTRHTHSAFQLSICLSVNNDKKLMFDQSFLVVIALLTSIGLKPKSQFHSFESMLCDIINSCRSLCRIYPRLSWPAGALVLERTAAERASDRRCAFQQVWWPRWHLQGGGISERFACGGPGGRAFRNGHKSEQKGASNANGGSIAAMQRKIGPV